MLQFFPFLLSLSSFVLFSKLLPVMFDSFLGNPFPTFDGTGELLSAFESPEPDMSTAGLDVFPSPKPVISSSSSDNQDPNQDEKQLPDEPGRVGRVVDERKRRRMESNRESARRSRVRKQRHLENLRNSVNQHRVENRFLLNRLRFTLHHVQCVRTENEFLESEYSILRRNLKCMRRALILRQLQEFSYATPLEQNPATISQYNFNNNLINC